MKTIILITTLLFTVNFNYGQQNTIKTITLSVKGNCEECKARIENAADIKGVKLCQWSEKTQIATITYREDKVSLEKIEQAIAASGHDAGKAKASLAVYNKLPSCCKYRDGKCEEKK